MTDVQIKDNLGIVTDKIDDIRCLIQEIREEYFEKYDRNNADDRICISWEYSRYKAFFNILINSLENIFEIIEETESNVLQQGLVEF